jgi:hypothetical protein
MAPATPLLFLDDAKAPNCRKHNGFKDLGNYSEWPKVTDTMIEAFDSFSLLFLLRHTRNFIAHRKLCRAIVGHLCDIRRWPCLHVVM